MDAICLANASVTALFFAAASGEAGSCDVVSPGGVKEFGLFYIPDVGTRPQSPG